MRGYDVALGLLLSLVVGLALGLFWGPNGRDTSAVLEAYREEVADAVRRTEERHEELTTLATRLRYDADLLSVEARRLGLFGENEHVLYDLTVTESERAEAYVAPPFPREPALPDRRPLIRALALIAGLSYLLVATAIRTVKRAFDGRIHEVEVEAEPTV